MRHMSTEGEAGGAAVQISPVDNLKDFMDTGIGQ